VHLRGNDAGSIRDMSKRSSIPSICSTVIPPDDGSGIPHSLYAR
jgi:hypothetical protein